MKGRGRGRSKTKAIDNSNNGNSSSSGLGAGVAGGFLASMSSSGGTTICSSKDDTFYCKMSRVLGIVGMTISFIIIFLSLIALIYFGYKYYYSKS
tara:strand:+ start:739 stop:1023 length:285 start_codon:yes stop_codon:yes gene_type:complete